MWCRNVRKTKTFPNSDQILSARPAVVSGLPATERNIKWNKRSNVQQFWKISFYVHFKNIYRIPNINQNAPFQQESLSALLFLVKLWLKFFLGVDFVNGRLPSFEAAEDSGTGSCKKTSMEINQLFMFMDLYSSLIILELNCIVQHWDL